MKRLILLAALSLAACSEPGETATWSLPPRDNLLARLLEEPMSPHLLFLRLNSALAALQVAAARRSAPHDCDQVPFKGCRYEVLLANRLGKARRCERSIFRIDDGREGAPVAILATEREIPCPPEVQ